MIRLVAAILLVLANPARADEVTRWRPHVAEASARFGVPTNWIEQVMRAESGGRAINNGRPIRSPKGAIGLMQLMPATWLNIRATLGLGRDPDDPHDNILAGTFYLRRMYQRFGYPGLFAAYNAGPKRYAAFLAGRPLPGETIAYLGTLGVTPRMPVVEQLRPARLFAVQHDTMISASTPVPQPAKDMLFAIRDVVP